MTVEMTGLKYIENQIESLKYKPKLSEAEWIIGFAPALSAMGIAELWRQFRSKNHHGDSHNNL